MFWKKSEFRIFSQKPPENFRKRSIYIVFTNFLLIILSICLTTSSFELVIWNKLLNFGIIVYFIAVAAMISLMFLSNRFLEFCQFSLNRDGSITHLPKIGPLLSATLFPLLSIVPICLSVTIFLESNYFYTEKKDTVLTVVNRTQLKDKSVCYEFKSLVSNDLITECKADYFWSRKGSALGNNVRAKVVIGRLGVYFKELKFM